MGPGTQRPVGGKKPTMTMPSPPRPISQQPKRKHPVRNTILAVFGALFALVVIGLIAGPPEESPTPQQAVAPPATVTVTEQAVETVTVTETVTLPAPAPVTVYVEPEVTATPERVPEPPPAYVPPAGSAYYENCTAARSAGAAPLYAGDPGYRSGLDRDGDGVACES